MSNRNFGTGQFGNAIRQPEANSFDTSIRRKLDGQKSEANSKFADKTTTDKFAEIVRKSAQTNAQRESEAISQSDTQCFLTANPHFNNTPANRKLMNHQLKSMGLFENATYPDFVAAYDALKDSNLLSVDPAEQARQEKIVYRGVLTGRTYADADTMVFEERLKAIQNLPLQKQTAEELEFAELADEDALLLLKQAERKEQHKGDGIETGSNGEAWATLHAEYTDSTHNAHLMVQQLRTNGVMEEVASIADYERAYNELRGSGLLSLNKAALNKQRSAELQQRAASAVGEPGSVFDSTTEIDMETMSMEELRERCNTVLGRTK
jgi:hypothetical protein